MTESKITATHRLQHEERWEEASLYRDEQRQQLRVDGMKRKDANEEAWRLMLERFPPFDEDSRSWYMALAEFPPQHLPESLQPEITDAWRVYCRIKAYCCYVCPGLADADDAKEATERRLRVDESKTAIQMVSPTGTNSMLRWAFYIDPLAFLELAATIFRQAHEQMDGDGEVVEATRQELLAFVSGLSDLRQAVRDHWPSREKREPGMARMTSAHSTPRPQSQEDASRTRANRTPTAG